MADRRPDRPLVVKCTFDRWNKRITFASARNCSYDLLRHKVEQCFSLYATSYTIAYKDDDGEVTDITTDLDLTEAVQYFQAGSDDPPLSSAASILSGRSFGSRSGSRKITLRVHITVDYDGPSLSDTSSLASMEEYKNRNGSQQSFSFGAPTEDLDDDSITVSSKDAISHAERPARDAQSQASAQSWDLLSEPANQQAGPSTTLRFHSNASDPFADEAGKPPEDPPSDPSAVFERLRLEESMRDDTSSVQYENLHGNERGAAWLRDQNARAIRNVLGALPEPSVSSDSASISLQEDDPLGGALALEQDTRGKYYYSYTSSSSTSQTRDSGFYGDVEPDELQRLAKPRPSSRNLHWLAAQQAVSSQASAKPPPSQAPMIPEEQSYDSSTIPPELLRFLPLAPPPPETLTDCSECGVLLDSIRYVCSVCGEKQPASQSSKGKGKSHGHQEHRGAGLHHHHSDPYPGLYHHNHEHQYPPRPPGHHHSPPSSSSSSVRSFSSGSTDSLTGSVRHFKPLPRIPGHGQALSVFSSQATLVPPGQLRDEPGYELCSGCIEHAGVMHAVEAGLPPGSSSPSLSPSSPEEFQRASEWRRLAPKKGQLRHAYQEKVWGHLGWEDVEQDNAQVSECSTCTAVTTHHRYKCASCKNFNLCRGCYSQVHDLHPLHAFLAVPDQPLQANDSDLFESIPPDLGPEGEKSLTHPGVRCAHCMLDIVGARFHCAICDDVDICANCESAGLPGNLDSSDGGHTSSHILIKIPYPLETDEVQMASRRAIHLWQGRDAANVGQPPVKASKANSVVSSYTRTVVGSGARGPPDLDHHVYCNGCGNNIVGVRYQCANCPSSTQAAVSLCAACEHHSYTVHDPSHVFFKLPRPVQNPLIAPYGFLPKLYKVPAGPPPGVEPQAYVSQLKHSVAVCDRCMSSIQGVWFRCAYCGVDFCDACEAVDTHNDSHCFMAFKSPVDMQALKNFASIENPPPVIPYPIYR